MIIIVYKVVSSIGASIFLVVGNSITLVIVQSTMFSILILSVVFFLLVQRKLKIQKEPQQKEHLIEKDVIEFENVNKDV